MIEGDVACFHTKQSFACVNHPQSNSKGEQGERSHTG